MRFLSIFKGPPNCPLCDKKMREVWTKRGLFYVCTEEFCMISIRKDDPCCGHWRDNEKTSAPDCPLCGKKMRMFFRADKFAKVQCRGPAHKLVQVMRGCADDLPPLRKVD